MAQSAEDQRALAMQQQVSELEALVSAAYVKGVEPARCKDIIEDAVRRARRKGAMLPHLDSSLVLSTLEQARHEIASLSDLSDVTATNAEVMKQELLHHQERAEERAATGGSEDVAAASVQSVPASSAEMASSHGGVARVPPSHSLGSGGLPEGEGSTHSGISAAGSGGGGLMRASAPPVLSVADAVAPIRDFASEVAAEVAVEAEEERAFRHSFSLKASKSGDFRLASSYDFETAMSPRASYHTRDRPFAFGPSSPGSSGSPGSPCGRGWMHRRSSEEAAGAEGEGEGEGSEGEEGSGLLMFSRGPVASEPEGPDLQQPASPAGQAATGAAVRGMPATPVRTEHAVPAAPRRDSGGGGGTHCWGSVVPPGLNPSAEVEGTIDHECFDFGGAGAEGGYEYETIDPQSPTGVGAVDLQSYSSVPFTLHSVTPPRHVMDALAVAMQGQLRM